jgi:hypothetical protein
MKRYISSLLGMATLLLLIVHPGLFYFNLGHPVTQERYLDDWYQVKEGYAASVEGRKLVLLADSNVLFGLDADRMEKELGRSTVNMGLHGALSRYILERAENCLQSGDIVVLPLAYALYEDNPLEKEYELYILGFDPEKFRRLSPADQIRFVYKVSPTDLIKLTWQQFYSPTNSEGPYSAEYLDKNGDMTNNPFEKRKSEAFLKQGLHVKIFRSAEIPSEESRREIGAFLDYCHANDIKVYATWPAMYCPGGSFVGADQVKVENIREFWEAQGVEVLGEYQDFLYSADMMYDTVYHLNNSGKERRTGQMIELLRGKL